MGLSTYEKVSLALAVGNACVLNALLLWLIKKTTTVEESKKEDVEAIKGLTTAVKAGTTAVEASIKTAVEAGIKAANDLTKEIKKSREEIKREVNGVKSEVESLRQQNREWSVRTYNLATDFLNGPY